MPTEAPRLLRLNHGSPVDSPGRQGDRAENGLKERPQIPGQGELSGKEDLHRTALVRRLPSTDYRQRSQSKNSHAGQINSSNNPGAHDRPFASEPHSLEDDAPEYHLWPQNPWRSSIKDDSVHPQPPGYDAPESRLWSEDAWRSDGEDISDQRDTNEINKPDSRLGHVAIVPGRLGASSDTVLTTPTEALYPVILDRQARFSRLSDALIHFFTQLESLVDQIAPGKQILQLFEAIPWLDTKIASTFGEEELDMLDRALNLVAHDEFSQPINFTVVGVKSTRFQTPKCLATYQRWGLCRPRHWAAVLVKAATGMSNSRRLAPPDDAEKKFMSDIVIYLKTSSFLAVWRAFLVECHSPLNNTTVLARSRSRVDDGTLDSGRKSFQEAVFNQLPSWPLGDDQVQDQNVSGAFLLTIAFCSDLVAPVASRHLPPATLSANLSEEATQHQGSTSTSENGVAQDILEQDPGKWDLPQVMARAIAPATLNTTWARLLLAKVSASGEEARAVLSDVTQIRDATRQGRALRPLQDALLAPSTDAVIAWLKTSRVDETRAFGDWLFRGRYRIHWILPAVLRRRLCHALFAAYVRLGLLAEAREILKRARAGVFGRGARSTLLRAFYRNGDALQFGSFWAEITEPTSRRRWGPPPRSWRYYRLRFLWKQVRSRAFGFLFSLSREGGLSNHAYTRLRASLISMASRDVQRKIGAEVEIADASLVLSPKDTDATRDVCIMALRHSICTGQMAYARLWVSKYRQHLDEDEDDDEPLDSARRLLFHCALKARKELNSRDIAKLFKSAIPLRFPSLDGPILKVLTQDTTAIARNEAEQRKLDFLMMAVAKTTRLFEEAVHCSQRSDEMQVSRAFAQFLASLPLKGSEARAANAVNAIYRLIDTLPKPPIKQVALYGPTESEARIERQDEARPESGKSNERRPQPWNDVEPQAFEGEERLQEKKEATTTPRPGRQPPTLNLVRKHLGGRGYREGKRTQHWLRYRPASARRAPSYDTDAELREAQPELEESRKGHSQPSENVEQYALEPEEGLPKKKNTTTPRLGSRPLTMRPQASPRPGPRIRKHKGERHITVRRLKSLRTKPAKSRQDQLDAPKPGEDAHIAGSERIPDPLPPLRIWKHKVWNPSTSRRPKLHNIKRVTKDKVRRT